MPDVAATTATTQEQEQQFVYRVTPLYEDLGIVTKGKAEMVVDQGVMGRKELATLWWENCPLCKSQTEQRRRCARYCRALRKHVGDLSRKLLLFQGASVIVHTECRYPNLIKLKPLKDEILPAFDVSIGERGAKAWMRFRIDVVSFMSECNYDTHETDRLLKPQKKTAPPRLKERQRTKHQTSTTTTFAAKKKVPNAQTL